MTTREALRNDRNDKLRVVHIIQPSSGGIMKQLSALCSRVSRERFDVHLIWSLMPGDPPYAEALQNVTLHRIDMVREISPLKDFVAFVRILKCLRRLRPDIVHAHSSKAGVLARVAAFLTRVPRVFYSPHGYSFLRRDVSPLFRGVYFAIEWSAARLGCTTIAVSPDEARLTMRLASAKRIRTVENGIDLSEIRPSPPRRSNDGGAILIGVVGRITAAKAPETFVEVAETLEARLPDRDFRFIWLGDGELRPMLENRVHRGKLRSGIEITGWLPQSQVFRWLHQLDIVVMPSLWEGMSVAILEAMAAGKPVVASDIVGNRTTVVDGVTGFLVRELNDYTRALEGLVLDPDLRARMGMAGRRRVEEFFSIEQVMVKYEKIYLREPSSLAMAAGPG